MALSHAGLRLLHAAVLWLRWQQLNAVSSVVSTCQSCAIVWLCVCVGGGVLRSSSHSVRLVQAVSLDHHGANVVNLMQRPACLQQNAFRTKQIATPAPLNFIGCKQRGATQDTVQYCGVHCQTCSPSLLFFVTDTAASASTIF
jgi:hypothetical protein